MFYDFSLKRQKLFFSLCASTIEISRIQNFNINQCFVLLKLEIEILLFLFLDLRKNKNQKNK
jgi:hypothetical protein